MKRHKYDDIQRWAALGPRTETWFREYRERGVNLQRLWRNWPCGACGLWKRAKVHR